MEQIFYSLERIYRMTHIPIRYMDGKGEVALFSRGSAPQQDPVTCDDTLLQALISCATQVALPAFHFEDEQILYGVCKDAANCYLVLGPASLEAASTHLAQKHAAQHHVNSQDFKLKHRTLEVFSACLVLACYMVTGKSVTETEIVCNDAHFAQEIETSETEYRNYLLENTEQEVSRFNYSDEMEFMHAIQSGDLEAVLARTDVSAIERVGRQAEKPLKNYEYLCCATITLASRAAMQGGLDSTTAYVMSDVFFQRLEKCGQISDILQLCRDVMADYALRVRQFKEKRSQASYIEKCKSYIENHLNKPFNLDDVSREIGINKSYLSRRFSEEVGVGIQIYTRQKRLEAAANMLKYSDEDISTISSYLCFPSQSYFGKAFKEQYEITPQKYRDREKLADFNTL